MLPRIIIRVAVAQVLVAGNVVGSTPVETGTLQPRSVIERMAIGIGDCEIETMGDPLGQARLE
jgi:hypothetical protein